MKILIYYFTGTGNSLLVAQKIAERIDGAVLKPVLNLYKSETDKVPADFTLSDNHTIGFIFPVYFDRIPQIIHKAIEKSQFSKTQYFFAVATSGGQAGNALFEMDSVLKSRGVRLDYGKNVDMPDNSIIIKTSDAKAAIRLAHINRVTDEIASAVINHKKMESVLKKSYAYCIMGKVNNFAVVHYYKAEKRQVDATRCNRCGMCVDICPSGNITMKGRKMVIGDDCQWCFACLNWCPKSAVVFGRIDPLKRQQYHCPGISVNDIVCKSRQ